MGSQKSGSPLLSEVAKLAAAEIAVEAAALDADGFDFIAIVIEEDLGASARGTLTRIRDAHGDVAIIGLHNVTEEGDFEIV
jgi:hypothetical protein